MTTGPAVRRKKTESGSAPETSFVQGGRFSDDVAVAIEETP